MEAKKREKKQRNREKPAMLKKLGKLVPNSLKKLGSKKSRPEQTDEQHQGKGPIRKKVFRNLTKLKVK